ncbi:MAG TPA: DUF3014 domain-containing protein [Rubrivivax sp.]|nr:DUF3014 domain-containing protein [Rubrivivax sp.]
MAEQIAKQSGTPNGQPPEVGARALIPPPRRPRLSAGFRVLSVLLLALAAGGWWAYISTPPPQLQAGPTPLTPSAALPAASAALPPVAAVSAAPLPEPKVAEGPLDEGGVAAALSALLGTRGMKLLIADDFVHRFVVTVDNLGREHAPPRLWPLQPTPGRFQVLERDGRLHADPDNAARYTPLVLLAEQIDPAAAVALYGRMLPLLQPAYEQLGYPGQRFHSRLMAVIDQLLASPDAPALLPLTLVEVKGELPSERPWLRYEFADAQFESASAGQKIMLRVGAVNQRRLKAQLRALRAELVRQAHL